MKWPLAVVLTVIFVLLSAVPAEATPVGTVDLFARLPAIDQGHPMGIAVEDEKVYTATGMWLGSDFMDNRPPTRGGAVYSYPVTGGPRSRPARKWRLQDPTDEQMGLAVTRKAVYTVAWGKVLRFNRRTGRERTYAVLPDLPACSTNAPPCQPAESATAGDRRPMGSGLTVTRDGTVYVADLFQGTIWRVPPGPPGRMAKPWFQDGRLGGQFFGGAGGLVTSPSGRSLIVAMDDDSRIYSIPLGARPTASDLKEIYVFDSSSGAGGRDVCSFTFGPECPYPEGLAFGASGRLYVVLSARQVVAVLRKGADGWRRVATYSSALVEPEASSIRSAPYGIAFDGRGSLIVTNNSFLSDDPSQSVLLRMFVGEDGARPAP